MSSVAVRGVFAPVARRARRPAVVLLLVGVAVALAVAAYGSPASRYPDAPAISPQAARTLKAQVHTAAFAGPAWWLQVVEAAPGAAHGELPDSRLAWRTLFGVQYGETVVADRQITNTFSAWRYGGVPAAFALVELGLLGAAAWLVRDRPR